jgi:hypothetical protein
MNAATVAAFDAVALLESLRGRGAAVSIKGTDAGAWLHVAPRGVLSDGERADFRRHKRELLAALNTPNESAPAHRWRDAPTGDASATDAAAPDVAASAPTGGATAMAPGDGAPDVSELSAIAPDVPGDAPDVPAWLSPELSRHQKWRAARLDGQRQARERRAIEAQLND